MTHGNPAWLPTEIPNATHGNPEWDPRISHSIIEEYTRVLEGTKKEKEIGKRPLRSAPLPFVLTPIF